VLTPRPRALLAVLALGAALGLVVVVLGLLGVLADERRHDDLYDGLGTFFGLLIAAGGLAWAAVHLALRAWVVRRPRSGVAACALSGATLAVVLLWYAAGGGANLAVLALPLLSSVAVAATALAASAPGAARPTRR
jgi:hypothetical protein